MSISSKPRLIGIAGSFASGKDTVAHHLVDDFGFVHVSTGDVVREIAQKERGSIERPVLREVADAYRHRDGAGVFVKHALQMPLPLVVTGIRSMGEARAVKEAGGVMLFIDASPELRYARMKARHRDYETTLSLVEFIAHEQKEWHAGDNEADFNLRDIKATADIVIENDLDLQEFLDATYLALHLKK